MTFEEMWEMGLTEGMTDGCGRQAVLNLLQRVIGLMRGLALPSLPRFWVYNNSSLASDSFAIHCRTDSSVKTSSDSDSTSSERSSSSEEPQTKKRKCGSVHDRPLEKSDKAKGKGNRVDLTVFMYYPGSAPNPSGRKCFYALLVEIFSRDRSEAQAKGQFMTEMIFALQNQSLVYGLFFSTCKVTLYKAERKCGDQFSDGKVTFQFQEFSLLGQQSYTNMDYKSFFNVGEYKKMVLAVFTALIGMGMKFQEL